MENKKVKYYFIFTVSEFIKDNFKILHLFIALLLIGGFVYIFYYINNKREIKLTDLKCTTDCNLLSIKSNNGISHSLTGTKIYIDSYIVSFEYYIEGKYYSNSNQITTNIKNQKLINSLLKYPNTKYTARYDCVNPNTSMIILRNKKTIKWDYTRYN